MANKVNLSTVTLLSETDPPSRVLGSIQLTPSGINCCRLELLRNLKDIHFPKLAIVMQIA